MALRLAGVTNSGTRRWFLWIPADSAPQLLVHAIEVTGFAPLGMAMTTYIGWQDLEAKLAAPPGRCGASPWNTARATPSLREHAGCRDQGDDRGSAGRGDRQQRRPGAGGLCRAHAGATGEPPTRRGGLSGDQGCGLRLHRRHAAAGRTTTEYEVQQFIMSRFAEQNVDPDHPPIVAVNRFATVGHYAPTAAEHNPIGPGDMVLIDLWARERNSPADCFADITWTGFCGATVPEAVQAVFNVAAAARDGAVAFANARMQAGEPVHGYEIDEHARGIITAAGYGDFIRHRTGHSLGSDIHYRGVNIDNLETQDRRRLIPGVMFTVEPGIYNPDAAWDDSPSPKGLGIRTEINCFVHPDRWR
ncbi:MAG: M24 family metallopeptidase [Caldilineaceae bacterium]